MKLYPFELPNNVHPGAKYLLGFGMTPDQINAVSRHLFDDLGVTVYEGASREVTYSWAVGLLGDHAGRLHVEVGDMVDIQLSAYSAVKITGGAPPPGVRLDKTNKKLVGTLTHTGLYSVTVTIGPLVKYDPLGSPGGPGDPGIWIPIDQPRQETITTLSSFPASAADLDAAAKDRLLAELLADRDGRIIREADSGN